MTVRRPVGDEGATLIELIVTIVVSALFAGMITLMFISGWTAQERSVSRDSATGQANLVKTTMSTALRNAVAVRVSAGGTRLDAQVATPSASYGSSWDWECRAWVLYDDGIRYSAGSTIRDTDPAGWTVIAGRSSQRPLDLAEGTLGPGSDVPFVLAGSKGVQIGFDLTVVAGDAVVVPISDGMTAQAVPPVAELAGATECWI